MKQNIRNRLDRLLDRLGEIDRELGEADATRDMGRFRELSRERAEIEPITTLIRALQQAESDCTAARELLEDLEMREFGETELLESQRRCAELEDALQRALLPRDPNDERNIFLEIRAGTGGEEAALFAADLLRLYTRHAERQRWKVEIISANESGLGGYREVITRIIGARAWSRLKFESGGHRVQRIPATETQGRIHTSACTVAVMPEADELEALQINPADLRIDTVRASGAGGQHINKTDSAVRITHLPSGLAVECQAERSQHSNKARAMAVLAARLNDERERAREAHEASTRRGLIGSGDRSERIRTYNFPQGRVTDHRINLTLYRLDAVMDGELDEIIDALILEHQSEQLTALAAEP
ncbi:MAG: peptide chain release factor 1 [Azoarcus sp.]|jgi:peptide chain release factor 1|nr:peptide chain release factor 1 [Azoarcus sp.]